MGELEGRQGAREALRLGKYRYVDAFPGQGKSAFTIRKDKK